MSVFETLRHDGAHDRARMYYQVAFSGRALIELLVGNTIMSAHVNITADWEYRFDPYTVGIAQQWFRPDTPGFSG